MLAFNRKACTRTVFQIGLKSLGKYTLSTRLNIVFLVLIGGN